METADRPTETQPAEGFPHLRRTRLAVGLLLLVGALLGAIAGVHSLNAAGGRSISVNPASSSELYYHATPITVTINVAGLSGAGLTPVSGYQYGLQWDPAVLQWVSGPKVGAGTPTVAPVLPCGQQIVTWGTPTATPTNFVPTYTPTPTNTPGAGTPTNTPTVTSTPTKTPTPGGYIQVACANISNVTPLPSGIVGTYKFQPVATGQAGTQLKLINVKLVDHNGATVIPGPTIQSGVVQLPDCHDLDGDGKVTILDMSREAAHFLSHPGSPNWDPIYDLNGDNSVNVLDLSILAAAFNQVC